MYYVLYDKKFKAIGSRKTYPVTSWSFSNKAFEFNELKIEGMATEDDTGAVFVGLHEDDGSIKVVQFSGVPVTKDGKSTINATDIRQMLNGDEIINLTDTSLNTVKALYEYLLNFAHSLNENTGLIISIDAGEADGLVLDEKYIARSKETGNVWDTLQAINALYECYIEASVDMLSKKITFKVRRVVNNIKVNLNDFNLPKIRNDFTKTNRVICVNEELTQRSDYYLLADDRIVEKSKLGASDNDQIIVPARSELISKKTLKEAEAAAIQKLAQNRFKESVEIDANSSALGYTLKNVDLTYMANLYGYGSSTEAKRLPVMSITENDKGNRTIKFGRLEEYWWL